ncbi:MAG: hypothetical protein IIB89_02505 [Chloroflexi bacterium]|nr:hypothetical protein [Chloroflexota bacterium]
MENQAAAPGRDEVWAVQPCLYNGQQRERGERFSLANLPTDTRLMDTHYIQRVQPKHSRYACQACAKVFVGGENFAGHLVAQHRIPAADARAQANRTPAHDA